MRTIPYVSMKKRKLVRSEYTLSLAVKKAVKYSSIQCSCNLYPSYVPPCVICTGRYSYMHSIDTEFMPYFERVSLLDSACHPVLCLPNGKLSTAAAAVATAASIFINLWLTFSLVYLI